MRSARLGRLVEVVRLPEDGLFALSIESRYARLAKLRREAPAAPLEDLERALAHNLLDAKLNVELPVLQDSVSQAQAQVHLRVRADEYETGRGSIQQIRADLLSATDARRTYP